MTHMTVSRCESKRGLKAYPFLLGAMAASTLVLAVLFVGVHRSHAATPLLVSPAAASLDPCATSARSQWTPVGAEWKLTVMFLQGSRRGQTEESRMTFLPDGSLTATFPGPTPSSPPQLPPATDGTWCMTGPNAFHYQFREVIQQGGQTVAYIQTSIDADLLSATTYQAVGIGIAYAASNGQPIPHGYNLTWTVAQRVSQSAR